MKLSRGMMALHDILKTLNSVQKYLKDALKDINLGLDVLVSQLR